MERRRRIAVLLLGGIVAIGCGGCAHRRQAYAPPRVGQGVHVRAPFVDIRVPTSTQPDMLGYDDDEDDD